jgi:amino acid transporter
MDGATLLFSSIVGSGIFASPGSVFVHSDHSGQLALLIWCLAGFIAYCGALCYLELALWLPSSGGESHYLSVFFGKAAGFLFTWANTAVSRPSSFAITSLVTGDYLCRFVFNTQVSVGIFSSI